VRFRGYWAAKCVAFLVLVPVLIAGLSWVVMSLWNALIPPLFHGPLVSFWQAVGLLVLSKILFGGFRGRGGHHGWGGRHGHWRREKWRQKWETLTPEERDRLRSRFRGRCGGWGSSEEPPPGESTQP
jgi:hypothetical protein